MADASDALKHTDDDEEECLARHRREKKELQGTRSCCMSRCLISQLFYSSSVEVYSLFLQA